MDRRFTIDTPLMWIDKAATWALAEQLGGAPLVELIVEDTHTCYLGDRGSRHDWGYGCGHCPACDLRAKGWEKWQAAKRADPRRRSARSPATGRRRTRSPSSHEGDAAADWLHAVLHKIEGDTGNARYWYRRTGQSFEEFADAQAELAAIRASISR